MKTIRTMFMALLAVSFAVSVSAQTEKRAVTVDELFKLKNVSGTQISPDGEWIAYVVS